ncbi:MAG: hypothetical protein OXJ37_19555 [Bryobacterales bacterium]|nr:hypothetical protein [Bryobacterales bacterium]MDE0264608.1 hypothetical protein [Bryobacterales bacterium]
MHPDLQRIDVKLLLDCPPDPDLDQFLVIFDRWRKADDHPADWVDLADYAHMPGGPGILIAGKRDTFSVNLNPPGPGLLTSVRRGLEGSLEDRFREALRRAREFNAAVMAEPEFPAEFSVLEGAWEIYVNDRLGFPNTDPTDRLVRPAVAAALGVVPESLTRDLDSRNRLGYSAK